MSIDLRGRKALVTGAASGIGLAIARALTAAGADVGLVDLPGPDLERAQIALPRSRSWPTDLTSSGQVEALGSVLDGVDILVSCAGLQRVRPVHEIDEGTWHHMLALLLTAPFLLIRRALPGMYARGWGRILNVSSVHGLVASPYKAAYVAAKHGLEGLTKTVALEAAARAPQVTAHTLCPAYVRTPLVERQIAEQARSHGLDEEEVLTRVLLERHAIKRLLEPEDVARAALFLCEESAWTMSGGALVLDAGWRAH